MDYMDSSLDAKSNPHLADVDEYVFRASQQVAQMRGRRRCPSDLRLRASKNPLAATTESPGHTRNWPNSAKGTTTWSERPATASSRTRTVAKRNTANKNARSWSAVGFAHAVEKW